MEGLDGLGLNIKVGWLAAGLDVGKTSWLGSQGRIREEHGDRRSLG